MASSLSQMWRTLSRRAVSCKAVELALHRTIALVGSFSGIPYRTFLLYEAPVAVVGLGCVLGVVWLVYRRGSTRTSRSTTR